MHLLTCTAIRSHWLVAKPIVWPSQVLSNIRYLRTLQLALPSTHSSCVRTGTESSSSYLLQRNVNEPVSLSVRIIMHPVFHVGQCFIAYSTCAVCTCQSSHASVWVLYFLKLDLFQATVSVGNLVMVESSLSLKLLAYDLFDLTWNGWFSYLLAVFAEPLC